MTIAARSRSVSPESVAQASGTARLRGSRAGFLEAIRTRRRLGPETSDRDFDSARPHVRRDGGRRVLRHDLPILDRDAGTRIVIHVHVVLIAVQSVYDVVSGGYFATVVHRGATLFSGRVGITLLNLFLDLVAGVASSRSSSDRGQHFAVAATKFTAQEPANYRAHTGAHQA